MSFQDLLGDLLRDGYAARFAVEGNSMRPTICPGDRLHVVAVPPETVRSGDVVVLRVEHGLLVHRIVRVDVSGITTRGDNERYAYPTVPASAVVGKVLHAERNGLRHDVRGRMLYLRVLTHRVLSGFRRKTRR